MGDGVIFVGVALGALERETENGFADAIDAIHHALHAELLVHDGAFLVDHTVAEEAGGCDGRAVSRVALRRGQEVAGELLDDKAVVGEVAIEGVDHPVAPDPLIARKIFFVAVAVGVAGGVEPVAGPFLAVVGRGEEFVDAVAHGGVGRAGVRREKTIELGERGRQAGEVEVEPAAERLGRSGG